MPIVRLPARSLPADASERDRLLAEYFAFERPATARGVNGAWEIEVLALAEPERWVDERLAEGLAWLGAPADLALMGDSVRQEDGFTLALNDAWGLWSAARWLQREGPADRVVILHADDHRDLSYPRLALDAGGYVDLISATPVRLCEPGGVASAIRSGAVGMGSFLTPLVWETPQVELRHLKVGAASASLGIQRLTEADRVLSPGAPRPAIALTTAPSPGSSYTVTCSPEEWVALDIGGPVIVHIDLDYLNNRYNADSHWQDRPGRHDPSGHEVLDLFEGLLDALAQPQLASRIVDIFVGISPGFFPAEHWWPVIETCRLRLPRLRAAA
ncbi:MAG: hypothetical protein ACRD12_12830 [Acidimicrobiales bacterium]